MAELDLFNILDLLQKCSASLLEAENNLKESIKVIESNKANISVVMNAVKKAVGNISNYTRRNKSCSKERVIVKDGNDGKDGRDGKDGKDGRDGRDGKDGKDGKDCKDNKVTRIELDPVDNSNSNSNKGNSVKKSKSCSKRIIMSVLNAITTHYTLYIIHNTLYINKVKKTTYTA